MNPQQRLVSIFTATFVGLVCGTLYLYSAYGPQLAHRLHLSGKEASLVAFSGTLGIAVSGVPSGLLIERTGFTVPVALGSVCIGGGYLGLQWLFDNGGAETTSVWPLALSVFLTGVGSTTINSAMIKCAAVAWPTRRGVATSFPIASYGLSAFVFSSLGASFFKGNTGGFLGLLGWSALLVGGVSLPVFWYVDQLTDKGRSVRTNASTPGTVLSRVSSRGTSIELQNMTSTSHHRNLGDELMMKKLHEHATLDHSPLLSLKSVNFWLLFLVAGILTSLGQMYIYSVGFMVKSLLQFVGADDISIQQQQQYQVSILSVFNCLGRLACGVMGDTIANQFNKSRTWILLVPAVLLLLVQIFGFVLKDQTLLWLESSLNGFGYGFTWAALPQILIELFGVNSFSFCWGFINASPILPAYFFTHLFGANYDSNLTPTEDDPNVSICLKGRDCYDETFEVTTVIAALTTALVILLVVRPIWLARGPNTKYVSV